MDPLPATPFTVSRDLPPYRAILAVDAKGFTDEPGSTHQAISGLIPQLVGVAFTRSGLAEVWETPSFFGPTGDGFAVGLPTEVLPSLVHPFLNELQRTLARHNRDARHAEARIRLRVSLHVGPLPVDPVNPHLGGNGTPRNDTHRLLDSKPVRAILAAASAEVTFVAAVLSDRVFHDVVVAGYTGRHPDHFVEVSATVPGKQFAQRAWLYVPELSGNLVTLAPPHAPDTVSTDRDPASATAPAAGPRVRTNHGQVATVVHGGMQQRNRGQR
ncbi:hypothetical protein ACNTMW_01340 [Planosporangium sp. 12N6]|uniref:hypothetical protein n=1 Tax=Planosporangium spinosum TaxID=3402278 RepID=UPI003CE9829D